MAKYHKVKFKEGEISFYPNLGAIASFEEIAGKSISEVFVEGVTPKFSDIYILLHESHKVACMRKDETPVSLNDIKSWVDGELLLKLFSDMITDLLEELGVAGSQKKTK